MPNKKSPTSPARVAAILNALQQAYPNAVCALHHKSAWQLTVATILSAQCTDVRVNLVTPALFRAFPTPKAMAAASLPELEELIRTTGFFRNKAKSIQGAGRVVTEEFHGKVPQTMPELLRIPGVARKTANVVLGTWFHIADGIVVDTHVLRIARRLQLTKETTRTRPDAAHPPAPVDRLHPSHHLSWPPGLHRPQAPLRRLPSRTSLQRPRQNYLLPLTLFRSNPLRSCHPERVRRVEGPRRSSSHLNPPPLSPTKTPVLALSQRPHLPSCNPVDTIPPRLRPRR
jgi:endonuclease III